MHEMGLGVKLNYTEESQWYQKTAIHGHKDAQKRLIEMRKKGLATNFQAPVLKDWQRNTAEPQSQYDIGVIYFRGIGVTWDYAIAYQWFYMAANQGHVKAQNDLAVLLSKGLGSKQNKSEAYIWFLRSAKQVFADSQYNLGVMF